MPISAATSLRRANRPFVGRKEERAFIEQRIGLAQDGEPQIMLVSGEAGIGKSRLLDEARARGRQLHFVVGAGRARQDMALPYVPFAEVLRPLVEAVRIDRRLRNELDLELVEEVLRPGGLDPAPGGSGEILEFETREQSRIFHTVSQVVIRAAEVRPTIVTIDDFHWADSTSARLLAHLIFAVAHHAETKPLSLVLLAGFRPLPVGSPVTEIVEGVRREQVASEIDIGGLGETDLVDLLESLDVPRPTATLVKTIEDLTLGNPLFVEETVLHLRRERALVVSGNRTHLDAPAALRLPLTVRSAISARTGSVSPDCQKLLIDAACLGDEFTEESVRAVHDTAGAPLGSLLDEAIEAGLVEGDAGALRFVHPMVRHAFYARLQPTARQRAHLRIARYMEAGDEPERERVIPLAHHLRAAGPLADAEEVVRVCREAGNRSFAICAWPEAALNFAVAIDRANRDLDLTARELAELHLLAGRSRFRMQEGDAALAHFGEAIELFRRCGDRRGLLLAEMDRARVYVTLSSVAYGTTPDLAGLLGAMEAIGEREERLRGSALALLAQVYWTARRPDSAIAAGRSAFEIGTRCGDDGLASDGAAGLALSLGQVLEIEESVRAHDDSVEYGRRAKDPWREATGAHRLPLSLVWLGRLDEAEERIRQAEHLTRETQEWSGASMAISAQVVIAVLRHELASAEDLAARIKLLADRSRYPWGGYNALPALATSYYLAGELSKSEQTLDKVLEPGFLFEEPGAAIQWVIWTYQQLVRLRLGVTDQMRNDVAAVLATISAPQTIEIGAVPAYCALAEVGDRLGDDTALDAIHHVLSFAWARRVVFTSAWVFLVPRVLATVEMRRENFDRAAALFDDAARIASETGATPELGRVYLDHARLLIRRSGGETSARVEELLVKAHGIFEELRMPDFESDAVAVGKSAGIDLASHSTLLDSANGASAGARERNMVVIVTDMVDSTATIARLGDEAGKRVLDHHNEIVRFGLRRFGAEIIRFNGDGFLASHTSPQQAIETALEIQDRLAAHSAGEEVPIRARIGVCYGPVRPDGEDLFGMTVIRAARLCTEAAPGEVLICERMEECVEDDSRFHVSARTASLKGFDGPQRYFCIARAAPPEE